MRPTPLGPGSSLPKTARTGPYVLVIAAGCVGQRTRFFVAVGADRSYAELVAPEDSEVPRVGRLRSGRPWAALFGEPRSTTLAAAVVRLAAARAGVTPDEAEVGGEAAGHRTALVRRLGSLSRASSSGARNAKVGPPTRGPVRFTQEAKANAASHRPGFRHSEAERHTGFVGRPLLLGNLGAITRGQG